MHSIVKFLIKNPGETIQEQVRSGEINRGFNYPEGGSNNPNEIVLDRDLKQHPE